MKKIIVASILSLMLLGVGGANSDGMRIGVGTAYADGDAHTWYFDDSIEEPTPMEDCIEAARKGVELDKTKDVTEGTAIFYIYDNRIYALRRGRWDGESFVGLECISSEPSSVIK